MMSARSAAELLLVGLVAGATAAAPSLAAEIRERSLRVPEPGLYEVALDAADLGRLTDAGGVEVVGPAGGSVPAERFAADRVERCRALEVERLARVGERWRVSLRVPEGSGEHAALRFELEDAVLASDCTLEAFEVGSGWRELARADLFRLGEGERLARTRFVYPATALRELRLEWPAEAGFPRVRSADACAPRDGSDAPRMPARIAPARPLGDGAVRVRIVAPPRPVRVEALELDLGEAAPAGLGYRLRAARGGTWGEIARGRWPAGESRLRLEIGAAPADSEQLAIDLHGPVSDLAGGEWIVGAQGVRFRARTAGRHLLRIPARAAARGPAGSGAVALEADPAVAVDSPPRVPDPGAELPTVAFARRWPVGADASPGDPVALRVGPEVRAASLRGLDDLRLSRGGRLVPARREVPAAPVQLVLVPGIDPAPGEAGWSRLEVELPGAERPAEPSQILLRSPAAPFERRVRVTVRAPESARRPERALPRWFETWRCAGLEPVPCELALPLSAPRGGSLRIEIEDGDSAPLAHLDVEILGRGSRLLFLWPGEGVELLAGSAELGAPRFDLAALDAALEVASPSPSTLGPSSAVEGSRLERFGRWLLVSAVLLVALTLLLLLRKLLPPARPAG